MYGMVNHGIETFVTETFGAEEWDAICCDAGLPATGFEEMLTYPDDVTYSLVAAICRRHGMAAAEALRTFGDYWVDYSRQTTVGKLMRFGGDGLIERLESLDEMHDRIKLAMPHLRPPRFEFEFGENGVHRLHYASEREGLEPMVMGLVEGLGRETGQTVEITQDPEPAFEGVRASFTIRLI